MEPSPAGTKRRDMPALVAMGKDAVSLLRDAALFLLAVLLIAFPTTFNSILERAGFEQGSVAGFTWRSKLVESDAALKDARALISDLQKKNDELSVALADATRQTADPSLKQRAATLEKENTELKTASQAVQRSVSQTIAASAPFVDRALAQTGGAKWGIVFSGDSTLDGAKYEVNTMAPRLGLPNAGIYFRQGSYRSVSVVQSKEEAERLLPAARKRRDDAYVVNMASWCPVSTQKDDYVECAKP